MKKDTRKNKCIQIRVTPEFNDKLSEITRILNTTKSQYIIDIIGSALDRHETLLKNVLTGEKEPCIDK